MASGLFIIKFCEAQRAQDKGILPQPASHGEIETGVTDSTNVGRSGTTGEGVVFTENTDIGQCDNQVAPRFGTWKRRRAGGIIADLWFMGQKIDTRPIYTHGLIDALIKSKPGVCVPFVVNSWYFGFMALTLLASGELVEGRQRGMEEPRSFPEKVCAMCLVLVLVILCSKSPPIRWFVCRLIHLVYRDPFISSQLNGANGEWTMDDDRPERKSKDAIMREGIQHGIDRALSACDKAGLTSGSVSSYSSQDSARNRKEAANRLHAKKLNMPREKDEPVNAPVDQAPAAAKAAVVAAAKEKKEKEELNPEEKLIKKYGPYHPGVDNQLVKLFLTAPVESEPTWIASMFTYMEEHWRDWLVVGSIICLTAFNFAPEIVIDACYAAAWCVQNSFSGLLCVIEFYDYVKSVIGGPLLSFLIGMTAFVYRYVRTWSAYNGRAEEREWSNYGASRIHHFTTLSFPEDCNPQQINAMAHNGYNAYRETTISLEALQWLKFQKTNKPSTYTQQQFADILLREFSVGRASQDVLFDTASFYHQLLISKHYMFKLEGGNMVEQIERM